MLLTTTSTLQDRRIDEYKGVVAITGRYCNRDSRWFHEVIGMVPVSRRGILGYWPGGARGGVMADLGSRPR